MIYGVVHKCFVEWEIETKVRAIVVNNATYSNAAVRMFKKNFSCKNRLPLGSKLFYIRCCAHIVNLAVQDGLFKIQDIIKKNVLESMKYIRQGENLLLLFSEIAKQLQLASKSFIIDCHTRRNATFLILSTSLEFNQFFPIY